MYILMTEKQGGSKSLFIPFEIASICVWLWYFFSETCRTAAYWYLHKQHMLGLHVTECLEQLFVCFPTLFWMQMSLWDRFSVSLIGTTFPWYYHICKLVVSQSVKQCMTVDIFPYILANGVDSFVAYTSFEQNTQVIPFDNVCKTL